MTKNTLISFDFAIKYLLKHKGDYDIVAGFISALLATEGYKPVKITALLDGESNREYKVMKHSIADLIVEDEQGQKFIVEIDRSYTNLFLNKACFNSCRLIVDSIASNQDYSTIKKVFHINLLYFPFSDMKAPLYHGKTIFHEIDRDHPQRFHLADQGMRMFDAYNVLPEYFIISIPLFDDVIKDEIDEWLYLMKHSEVKESFKSPYMKKVAQRLNILKMPPNELSNYYEYTSKSLKERDYIVSGIAKGIAEGEAKGKAEGKADEKIAIAKNLLKAGLSLDLIVQATGLTIEKIMDIKDNE